MNHANSRIIHLDVGGQLFRTTIETLQRFEGYFQSLTQWPCGEDKGDRDHPIFIDRDPQTFPTILSFLRSGAIVWSDESDDYLRKLSLEAQFYCLQDLTQAIESELMKRGLEASSLIEPYQYQSVPAESANEYFEQGWAFVESFRENQSSFCISMGCARPADWDMGKCTACRVDMTWEKFLKHIVLYERQMIAIRRPHRHPSLL